MKEFARHRLHKASEAAEAARLLAGEDYPDAAADRAYYAMFYAVEALLSEQDLTFSRHGAVHAAFGRLFAKTGELDPKYHRWLIQAFEARQTQSRCGSGRARCRLPVLLAGQSAPRSFTPGPRPPRRLSRQ